MYRPVKKANVFISKNFKKVFYGMRTLYAKDHTGTVYVRYSNKYYRAYYDGRNTYNVRL
jgi:hypothetical protein